MNRLVAVFLLIVLPCVATTLGYAQATRTWVSGVGDDVNPCSRTAPCKTFAGAISKTAAGGEISALDPAGFGAVTITKSITLNGDGGLASILVSGSNAITVSSNLLATDVVILRSLSLVASNNGGNTPSGISYLGGGLLVVENCTISGFTGNGINMSLSGSGNLTVRNTSITGGSSGVRITSSSGTVQAQLDNVSIRGAGNGVYSSYGATTVSNSVLSQNTTYGALADGGGTMTLVSSTLTGNGTAAQALSGGIIRLSNNDVFDNAGGFRCDGGAMFSAGNNRKGGNLGSGTPCVFSTPAIAVQ